jgi:hypothetical protein
MLADTLRQPARLALRAKSEKQDDLFQGIA